MNLYILYHTYTHPVVSEGPFIVHVVLRDDHSAAVPLLVQPQSHVLLTSGKREDSRLRLFKQV